MKEQNTNTQVKKKQKPCPNNLPGKSKESRNEIQVSANRIVLLWPT